MSGSTRVLVTGATGFVGSHLIDALAGGPRRVRALVRAASDVSRLEALGIERVEASLGDVASLAAALEGVDAVLHLAAATKARTEADYRRANAEGTRALVQAALAARPRPRRFVYLSSLAAVGPSFDARPVTAETPPQPLTAYGRTKLEGERACLEAVDRIEVVVLRAAAVYGPRDRDLYTYFRLAERGLIPVPRGPDRPVQLVHAADLARALVRSLEAPRAAGVYHIAEPRAYAWSDVARRIASAVGRRAVAVPVPAPLIWGAASAVETAAALAGGVTIFNRDKVRELLAPGWTCETEAAARVLGFEAEIALDDGLAATAEWYRERGWLRRSA